MLLYFTDNQCILQQKLSIYRYILLTNSHNLHGSTQLKWFSIMFYLFLAESEFILFENSEDSDQMASKATPFSILPL